MISNLQKPPHQRTTAKPKANSIAVSFATGDFSGGTVMTLMLILGVALRFVQESRADAAAAKLKGMISVTTAVVREGREEEVPLKQLVPGDIVKLCAGDMVPADVRLVASRDLFVAQAALTGESLPVEKLDARESREGISPLELANVCFLGTSVESGSATAVVAATGGQTYFGRMASGIIGPEVKTSFDKGMQRFTVLMIQFILVMVPLVFLINGFTKHNWQEAFFFSIAVAVGLTPEMLPMIVSVCLSNGALAMSKKKVIVKRLNSIQNLGAMDVLCTDKTGTLTLDRVILELVTRKVCKEVGLAAEELVLGSQVEMMSDEQLEASAERVHVFARVSPAHKQRIIRALRQKKHVVGFMGDGINDAPALRVADVGISVDSGVDIAKELATVILLEKSLMVLEEGVIEGCKVFVNILKYIRMGASYNFGNVIRTKKIPFIEGGASWALTVTTVLIMCIGMWLPYSPLAATLGFVHLPRLYWPILFLTLLCYVVLTQLVKMWLMRRSWL
jgi:magnesium-transporting ATPase (P-type)